VASPLANPTSVGEPSEVRAPGERERRDRDQRAGADHDDDGADHRVEALVVDPAWRDPLVDDVRLLEEQLPRGDRGADDRDDQQHGRRAGATTDAGDEGVMNDVTQLGVGED